jgi:hypothetical protein
MKYAFYFVLITLCGNFISGCAHNQQALTEENFYHIPVRGYILKSDVYDLNSRISETEFVDSVKLVNDIWRQANIRFFVTSIEVLKATNEQGYLTSQETFPPLDTIAQSYIQKSTCVLPEFDETVLNVCVMGRLFGDTNGVYFNDDNSMIMWPTTRFGLKNTDTHALAHEFGHFLDLPHNYKTPLYLMRDKRARLNTRKYPLIPILTKDEIIHARNVAKKYHVTPLWVTSQ